MSDHPRILITRLSHIGDCVLTLPLVCAIKRAYPGSTIGWCMESPTHKLIGNHEFIDQLFLIDRGWLKRPTKWRALRRQLKEFQPDIVLDPQSLTKSSLLGRLSGAKRRIGFGGQYRKELSGLLNNRFVQATMTHLVDRTMELLSLTGLDVPNREIEFRLPISESDHATADTFLTEESLEEYLVINPGASWASKRWVNHRFGYVARYAYQANQIRSLVTWAGDEEKKMAEEIVEVAQGGAIMAPSTSLGELAAFLHRSEGFIGCDTGPLHIAAAVGATCIGLYGPTLPGKSGAYGPQHIAIQKWHQNDRNRRKASNLAMQEIEVDDVCTAVDRLFAARSKQAA